jgi:periplasmic copper chaperone A
MRMLSLIVLAAATAGTPPPMSGHIMIAHAWFRFLPAHLPAGGYFDLRNVGQWPITLTSADSAACGMLMLHKSEQKNGVDSMSDVTSIDIPAGSVLRFAPGGYHLMCMDPGPTLKPGSSVSVRLTFSDGSVATMRVPVKTATGQ